MNTEIKEVGVVDTRGLLSLRFKGKDRRLSIGISITELETVKQYRKVGLFTRRFPGKDIESSHIVPCHRIEWHP